MTRRLVHRSDANASPLLKFARKLGLLVEVIERPTDWLVFDGTIWFPAELKVSRGTYTDAQKTFLANCAGRGAPVLTWRCEQDILDYVNVSRGALVRHRALGIV